MINLILCGGAGTRLWPLSRNRMPKQFYPLFEGRTLFEETVLRNKPLVDGFWVASNLVQMELARDQLARSGVTAFGSLVESIGRNTAPAIALVALNLDPKEIILVTPSDHLLTKPKEYAHAVERATELAKDGYLVTFGIRPTYPETGFGYIEADGELVLSFKEKPDLKTAEKYISQQKYLWNSGMFVFQAGAFLSELKAFAPEVYQKAKEALGGKSSLGEVEVSLEAMKAIPSVSIDVAVMEQSKNVRVVPCDPGWSDLGSFDSLFDETEKGLSDNAVVGSDAPIFVDAHNNMVVGSSRKVALIDVENLIIVDTKDALLIVKRGSSQKVKDVVTELKKSGSGLLE